MKHHFMRISPTTVRIELIPKDNDEKIILIRSIKGEIANIALDILFQHALDIYRPTARLARNNFMDSLKWHCAVSQHAPSPIRYNEYRFSLIQEVHSGVDKNIRL